MGGRESSRFKWPTRKKDIVAELERVSDVVDTAAGKVEFARVGEGPEILVVHGGQGGYDQGLALSRPFAEGGFSIIAVSRPGYLRTPTSTGRTFTAQADALAALLEALGVDRAGVVGGSAGGPPSYLLAARHPGKVAALVTIDAISRHYPMPDNAGKFAQAVFMSGPGLWLSEFMMLNYPRPLLKEILKASGLLGREELKRTVAEILDDPTQRYYALDFFKSTNPYSLRKQGTTIDLEEGAAIDELPLEQVRCPVLVVHGKKDGDVKFSDGEHAAATIPGAEHYWLENGTHFGFWLSGEAAGAQNAAVEFMRKHLA